MPQQRERTGLAELRERAHALYHSGEWDESLACCEEALARLGAEGTPADACEILRRVASIRMQRREMEVARELFEASLVIAELNQLPDQRVGGLIGLAILEQFTGELVEAERRYREAAALAESVGNTRMAAICCHNLATIFNIRGEVAAALEMYRAALDDYRQIGEERSAAALLSCMGMAHVDLSNWADAEGCYDQAAALAASLGDTRIGGIVEINRAELYLKRGQHPRAREHCDRAAEIYRQLGLPVGMGEVDKVYGMLHREAGERAKADTHFTRAVELAQAGRDPLLEAEVRREWALLHLKEERSRDALWCLNRAHHLFTELHARRDLLDLDRRLDSLEATYLRVVQAWGESIESRDQYTSGRAARVADHACRLAEAVGLAGRDLLWFRMGAHLHDVGKTAVHPDVLNKPGKLNALEWRLMQRHTTAGDAIVAELNFPWDIRPLVRSHHERWDGGGYPDGLRGEEIPLGARIVCLADAYDALTTQRPFRPAYSSEQALAIMQEDVGRIFDPRLFPVFREIIEGGALPADPPRLFVSTAA